MAASAWVHMVTARVEPAQGDEASAQAQQAAGRTGLEARHLMSRIPDRGARDLGTLHILCAQGPHRQHSQLVACLVSRDRSNSHPTLLSLLMAQGYKFTTPTAGLFPAGDRRGLHESLLPHKVSRG